MRTGTLGRGDQTQVPQGGPEGPRRVRERSGVECAGGQVEGPCGVPVLTAPSAGREDLVRRAG